MSAVETDEKNEPADELDGAGGLRELTPGALRAWLVVVLALASIGAGGFALNRLTNVGGPDSVCDGVASADQVHDLLGSGRISEHKDQRYSLTENWSGNNCDATVRSGLFETSEKTVHFTIRRGTDDGPAELAASDARLFPGGSVTPTAAWAVLPEGCDKGVRAEVTTYEEGHDVKGHDEERARLAVSFANATAKARACGDRKIAAPKSLSAKGAETDPDWASLCGLPGFAPAKDPRIPSTPVTFRQQVTTASDPIWFCTITDGSSSLSPQIFAITTEPQATTVARRPNDNTGTVGRAQWVAHGTLIATCRGKDVYFTVMGGSDPSSRTRLFPDQDGLVRQFLTVGGKAIGCEPIL
ncbi:MULTISPECIES: hypothetical protein [Kitasatospora]|uniref:DUF4232 domain-containing protein n=1 Tax=Kitasatospora cathayae TaxID=3004092 RepID=A0ABY7PXK7_9ACTN|nr:hypothetical protein [Kitasatospora sp. HUAS 3-15]WBP85167.1 hypothetical protein O1G21_04385 [Kitasatospora sp. HUAS 3-15]